MCLLPDQIMTLFVQAILHSYLFEGHAAHMVFAVGATIVRILVEQCFLHSSLLLLFLYVVVSSVISSQSLGRYLGPAAGTVHVYSCARIVAGVIEHR